MQTWELIPYKSVGPIFFTDTKNDIIKKLGEPKEVSRKGDFLTYDEGLISINEGGTFYWFSPDEPEKCEIAYDGLILNILDYKQIIKKLFFKKHEIYGDFSSFPMYVDKDIGVGFITHESSLNDSIELEGLQIFSQEAMPNFNDKKLCPDDILITREDQII